VTAAVFVDGDKGRRRQSLSTVAKGNASCQQQWKTTTTVYVDGGKGRRSQSMSLLMAAVSLCQRWQGNIGILCSLLMVAG